MPLVHGLGHCIGDAGAIRGVAWVHRFNTNGLAGLINGKAPGPRPKLSPEQKQELKRIVETPPDPINDGIVRWRCVDLRRIIQEQFPRRSR